MISFAIAFDSRYYVISICSKNKMQSTGDSAESIEMRYEDENIWLTQKMMAELYNVDVGLWHRYR